MRLRIFRVRSGVRLLAGALLERYRGRQGIGILVEAARRDVVDR
jgi:hypothetical protein